MNASTETARTAPVASPIRRPLVKRTLAGLLALGIALPAYPTTPLANGPVFASVAVPGNVALALSVEWPTASRTAHTADYASTSEYLGYFDPNKCYRYTHVAAESATSVSHFFPDGAATNRQCTGTGQWSGNFLNWATMTTIDPFRWVLTGGNRIVDTDGGLTILQRTWHSGQGLFGDRNVPAAEIAGATPFTWAGMRMNINGRGFGMRFRADTGGGGFGGEVTYTGSETAAQTYTAMLRVRVCDSTTSGAGPLEANCQRYPNGFYKPTGLMHEYADRMRFAAFGYLNDGATNRDGGVMRARMKFVGPVMPVPGSASVTNPNREWDANSGVFLQNPDPADASDTDPLFGTISWSGAMNYLNKFGQIRTGNYKSLDPVSEMYYGVLRYFKNQGNVDEWWSPAGAPNQATRDQWADGFPVIETWGDPMTWGPPNQTPVSYACQRNFVIGIGDIYTWNDKNLPGNPTGTNSEPTKPRAVDEDTTVDSVARTIQAFALQGLGAPSTTSYSGRNNSAGMVGLAYDANITDIRPDLPGRQWVSTYWVDVLEAPFVANNQFYLTAKFGGFTVPDNYTPGTALEDGWWRTNSDTVGTGGSAQPRPDNYFTGGRPDQVQAGLRAAFARIASQIEQFTTSFATALPQVATTGNASFSASYNGRNWTGELVGSTLSFDTNDSPVLTENWRLSQRLATQIGTGFQNTGWDTGRRIATWNGANGIAFRHGNLSSAQQALVDPSFTAAADGEDLVNYIRGQRLHEQAAPTGISSGNKFRTRPSLANGDPSFLGDISGSKLRVVGPPSLRLADATNPGYSSFRSAWQSRPTMVYFGANDGLLRGVQGDLTGTNAGREVFAYVPSALFGGPSGTPQTNGLVALANPNFVHYNFVNATPTVTDIDLARTVPNAVSAPTENVLPAQQAPTNWTPNWQSVLIGGLGSGGRSYFALNVTNPAGITTEAEAANRVMWEFSDSRLGLTFGEPVVVKTRRHGWVAVFPSGYNNANGRGYFLIVNPRNGQLIQAVDTGVGTAANQAGLAHIAPFFVDRTDGLADAIYGGDLFGNVWRLDLTAADATTGLYPAPTRVAQLNDGAAAPTAQPITSPPIIEIDPSSNRRYILVGTGRALDTTDLYSGAAQTFYAIQDGNGASFARTSPSGTWPLTRANLAANTDPAAGVTMSSSQFGWYVDLGTTTTSGTTVGWRVVNPASSFAGTVAFSSILPGGSACEPSGSSRVYAINLSSGRSVLPGATTGTYVAYSTALRGLVTDLRYFSVNGQRRLIAGSDLNDRQRIREDVAGGAALRRLNWREVPVTD